MSETPIYDNVANGNVGDEFKPDISKRVRTIAYFAVFIVGALCVLIGALAPIWLDSESAGKVALTVVAILGFVSTIGGIFGIAYRPTKHS